MFCVCFSSKDHPYSERFIFLSIMMAIMEELACKTWYSHFLTNLVWRFIGSGSWDLSLYYFFPKANYIPLKPPYEIWNFWIKWFYRNWMNTRGYIHNIFFGGIFVDSTCQSWTLKWFPRRMYLIRLQNRIYSMFCCEYYGKWI